MQQESDIYWVTDLIPKSGSLVRGLRCGPIGACPDLCSVVLLGTGGELAGWSDNNERQSLHDHCSR
jgi:hypothetical protein